MPNFAPQHVVPGIGVLSAQNQVQNVAVSVVLFVLWLKLLNEKYFAIISRICNPMSGKEAAFCVDNKAGIASKQQSPLPLNVK